MNRNRNYVTTRPQKNLSSTGKTTGKEKKKSQKTQQQSFSFTGYKSSTERVFPKYNEKNLGKEKKKKRVVVARVPKTRERTESSSSINNIEFPSLQYTEEEVAQIKKNDGKINLWGDMERQNRFLKKRMRWLEKRINKKERIIETRKERMVKYKMKIERVNRRIRLHRSKLKSLQQREKVTPKKNKKKKEEEEEEERNRKKKALKSKPIKQIQKDRKENQQIQSLTEEDSVRLIHKFREESNFRNDSTLRGNQAQGNRHQSKVQTSKEEQESLFKKEEEIEKVEDLGQNCSVSYLKHYFNHNMKLTEPNLSFLKKHVNFFLYPTKENGKEKTLNVDFQLLCSSNDMPKEISVVLDDDFMDHWVPLNKRGDVFEGSIAFSSDNVPCFIDIMAKFPKTKYQWALSFDFGGVKQQKDEEDIASDDDDDLEGFL